ncbi:MAG: CbiQ family ECF transporter T component, partial [Desulfonatronovibrio sp.]
MSFKDFISKTSLLQRLDPRIKLFCLIILAFTYSYVSKPVLLMIIVGATFFLLALSRLPFSFILGKLKLPSFIILALVITLPFVSG